MKSGAKEVDVVYEEDPLEDEHLVDIVGPERGFVCEDGEVLSISLLHRVYYDTVYIRE